jgi:type III secretion protein J
LALLIAVMCAACNRVELYGNLAEEDANEMLVLLSEKDITAQKKKEVRQNEVFYSIVVNQNDVAEARSLLVQHRLPRRRQLGLTGVYKEKGLIPTPDEQKARFLLALKGELINSLERVPDVVDADVVLNVPTVDEFADPETKKRLRPTASVVMKVKPSAVANQIVTEAKIQQFVANGVEGLNPRDITVIISYLAAEEPTVRPGEVISLPSGAKPDISRPPAGVPETTHSLIGLTLDAGSKAKLKMYLLVFFVVLLVLSAILILAIIQGSRMRRELNEMRGEGGPPAVEGQVMEESPRRLGAPTAAAPEPSDIPGEAGEGIFEEEAGGEDEEEPR